MKRSILVIAISVLHSSLLVLGLNAQELAEVKGKVVDAATNMPAAGVQVQAYNDPQYAAMTDDKGEYTIKLFLNYRHY